MVIFKARKALKNPMLQTGSRGLRIFRMGGDLQMSEKGGGRRE